MNYCSVMCRLLTVLAMTLATTNGVQAQDELPALKVSGKHLIDPNGNNVVLHGVMDTPNRYFNSWRWQGWKPGYGDEDVKPCIDYFNKLFTAITDHEQGAYCTVFRLHLDPCWTNDPNKPLVGNGGEQNISQFSQQRLVRFWKSLYSKIMENALAHGLYVILRPPGVCPHDLKVEDDYQEYLKTVWGTVAQTEVLQKYAGQVSIELANEPVNLKDANGKDSKTALRDYFQPIVDEIRENGFTGVIWVPGTGYQSQYADYARYPIKDDNFGYAVHVYAGWYGNMTDNNCNSNTFIRNFKNQVPVVETNPIMVTEIDWSPNDPSRKDEGHYNEWGQWTAPNFGSWATASTSKWGKAWKAVHDHYGNIGMTLTSTDDYFDVDEYLKSGKVLPSFQKAKDYGLLEECCGYACFQWYKEFYEAQCTNTIEGIEADNDEEIVSRKYYNMQGVEISGPTRTPYIYKEVKKGGKTKITKRCNIR